jgi:hypothetical protein
MAYPIWARPQHRLPSTYAHSHMPTRNFSPFSTRSVRLNIPHIPHLETPSSPFPDNAITIDVGSWTRDVGLSIRTESSPSSSIFGPSPDYVEESVLDTDSDYSPVLSPSNSEYQLDVDYPRLMSPSNSDNNLDIDAIPRASGRLNDSPRQPSNTSLNEIGSPSHYSDSTTVCYRSAAHADDIPSMQDAERIITPLPDATIDTSRDTDLSEASDLGTSTSGLNPNSKSFVPSKSHDTARRIIRYDRTNGEYTYIDEPIPEHLRHQYQGGLPDPTQDPGTSHGHRHPLPAPGPSVVLANRPHGPSSKPPSPPGFQYNLPPGLPLTCHPVQHGLPPGLLPNVPPQFQPGPPPGLQANIPPRFRPGPPSGLSVNIPPRFRPNPPPGFPPRPYVEPQHHEAKPVDKPVSCEPYLDFEHAVPKFINDYRSGRVDIHPHYLDRFIPKVDPVPAPKLDRLIPIEDPISPLPIAPSEPIEPSTPISTLPISPSEPIEPASPGPPSKTIYMIRAGKGRSSYVALYSCER